MGTEATEEVQLQTVPADLKIAVSPVAPHRTRKHGYWPGLGQPLTREAEGESQPSAHNSAGTGGGIAEAELADGQCQP